jgi:hypothetical protein
MYCWEELGFVKKSVALVRQGARHVHAKTASPFGGGADEMDALSGYHLYYPSF